MKVSMEPLGIILRRRALDELRSRRSISLYTDFRLMPNFVATSDTEKNSLSLPASNSAVMFCITLVE